MNKFHRTVLSAATGKWVVASELAKGRAKKSTGVTAIAAAVAALGMSLGLGSNVVMAATTPTANKACTTAAGQAGTIDGSGVCTADSLGRAGIQSIGTMASATELDSWLKFGGGATGTSTASATGIVATALGANARAEGDWSTAIGGATGSDANGPRGAYAKGNNSTAIGSVSEARADNSVALGDSTLADRANTVSVGAVNNRDGKSFTRQIVNVAAGTQANDAVNVSQLSPVVAALGGGAAIDMDGSITGPTYQLANGGDQTTVGGALGALDGALTTANSNIKTNTDNITQIRNEMNGGTIGLVQQAKANDDLTVGANTDGAAVNFTNNAGNARKLTGVADGDVSDTSLDAVNGSQLHATNDKVTRNTSDITKLNTSVTNIDGRVTTAEGDITTLQQQIGNGSVGLVQQGVAGADLTVGANTDGTAVNFTNKDGTGRLLTGVANGMDDSDVATIAQLKAMGLFDPNSQLPLAAVAYDGIDLDSVTFGGKNGTGLFNIAAGRIEAGSMDGVNGGQLYAMQQEIQNDYKQRIDDLDGRVGNLESGDGSGGGSSGGSGAEQGRGGAGSIVVGDGADASGSNSSAIGQGSAASGDNSSAVGQSSNASGSNGTAIGQGSVASGSNGTAIGQGAAASGSNGTAIGQGSSASGNNSVAIGAGSVADRDNSVSVGSAGNERQITSVAAGTAPTDAVNVQQMHNAVDSSRQDAMGGVAAAMAVAGLPQSSMPGRTFMAISGSTYGGEYGTAVGVSYMTKDGKWTVKGAVNTSSRGEVGAAVGGGFYW